MTALSSETVTLEQAARLLNTNLDHLKQIIYDHKLIRPCIYSQFVPEFLEAKDVECKLSKDQADFSTLYKDIPDGEERLARKNSFDLLNQPENDSSQAHNFDRVRWHSPPPRLFYLNLNHAHYSPSGANHVPIGGDRLTEYDNILSIEFETVCGVRFYFQNRSTQKPISVSLPEMLISRKELSRVSSMLFETNSSESDSVEQLELLIAAELRLLLDRRSFFYGKNQSASSITEYVRRFVDDASGLSPSSLSREITSYLKLLERLKKL